MLPEGRLAIESLDLCAARPSSSGIPASGTRAENMFVTPDRDLAAIADPVVTLAAPSPGKSQGLPPKHRTQTEGGEHHMPRIIKPTMNHWERGRPHRRMRSRRRDYDDRGRRHDRSRDRSW